MQPSENREPCKESNREQNKAEIKLASNATVASLLNLTFLPVISFLWLLFLLKDTQKNSFGYYHVLLAIKLNLIAAVTLGVVSLLMIFFGGFESPWTWVFVITYFTLVHSIFIVVAVWAMIRAWSGQKLR